MPDGPVAGVAEAMVVVLAEEASMAVGFAAEARCT